MTERLKRMSTTERKEVSNALAETVNASPEEIRQILRRTAGPVTHGLATLVSRVRSDLVVLFVSQRDISAALAIPTTKILTQQDLKELTGMSKQEAEVIQLTTTTEGYVKFGDTFVCVRDRKVHDIVVKEKTDLALSPLRQDELFAAEVRSRLPKSEAQEEFVITQGGARALD